jgi:hypothetical protein
MIPDADGFKRNATIEDKQQGVCSDVDGLIGVTTNDEKQIFMNLLYDPGQYPRCAVHEEKEARK